MIKQATSYFNKAGLDLTPTFELEISGKSAGGSGQLFESIRPLIAGVIFEDDERMSTQFTLDIINHADSSSGQPVDWGAVIDSKAFTEGNFVDLYMGYGSEQVFMDRVELAKWNPEFPEEGPSTFRVQGFDGRHRLQRSNRIKTKKKSKRKTFYKNRSDDQIVQQIADKYGFGVDADTPEVKRKAVQTVKGSKTVTRHVIPNRIQPVDLSDWEFLQKLAMLNRFDLWVDWSQSSGQFVIHFKKKKDAGAAGYEFQYNYNGNGSLLSASPDFSIKEQPTQVEILSFDRKTKTIYRSVIEETQPAENVSLAGGRVAPYRLKAERTLDIGARVRFRAFGQTIDAFSNRPFRSQKEAMSFVSQWLKDREAEATILTGRVVGLPTLRSRQIHKISGLGRRLDGFYRFTNVKHKQRPQDGIYHVEFVAHKVLSEDLVVRSPVTKKVSKR